MSRNCPECGGGLLPAVGEDGEDRYACIQCGYSVPEDDAPPATGSPLDVRANPGTVLMDVPVPGRHRDTKAYRMSPDAARRLAEALEQGADDAERRGGDGGGGHRPDPPHPPVGGDSDE